MRRSRLLVLGVGLALALAWCGRGGGGDGAGGGGSGGPAARGAGGRSLAPLAAAIAEARARGGRLPWTPPPRLDGAVTISGAVRDLLEAAPVPGAEVVFRGELGEETTTTGADGRYRIDLPIGTYRAFVRDDRVLSVWFAGPVRLPAPPTLDLAGAPDEDLMVRVDARADADDVDLSVVGGGAVRGRVVDGAGRPVASAVVRARTEQLRPTLGTDVAETADDGTFELRLPTGAYELEVSHARFAGPRPGADGEGTRVLVARGGVAEVTIALAAGCIVSGRVVRADGSPAGDGAIERRWGEGELEFAPQGRIEADGTFRWTTTEEAEVVLRAWPWKAPPSPARAFACRDGARYTGVVLALPDRGPDLDGVLVDASGAPVPSAYVDIAPRDPGGMAQQERSDAQGRWSVYALPPGRYRVTAVAPGRGVVAAEVTSPAAGVRLALGGTGRIEGTAVGMAQGSFELVLGGCRVADGGGVRIPNERRLVVVRGGAFAVDDVPACQLVVAVYGRRRPRTAEVDVPAGGVARLELDLRAVPEVGPGEGDGEGEGDGDGDGDGDIVDEDGGEGDAEGEAGGEAEGDA